MKNILYIGNHLQSPGSLPTGIHSLSDNLRREGNVVITASGRQGKLWRLTEMLSAVYRNRSWADFVLIDTYSTRNFWYAYAVARLCQRLGLKYIPILHGGELPRRLKENPEASEQVFSGAYVNVAPSRYLMEWFSQSRKDTEATLPQVGTRFIAFNSTEEARGTEEIATSKASSLKSNLPSLNTQYSILNTKPDWPLKYIPNSLDLSLYPFQKRKTLRPRLLWVRAFAKIYNPMLALRGLEVLRRKYPQAELCMVGPKKDASLEECWEFALQRDLPVKFTGKLEKSEWTALAEDYDIFINTTNIDNTPVSVLEAMALGLPVISTRVGGMPYLINDGEDGFLVRPDDPDALAQAVQALIEHPEQGGEISLAARRKVEEYEWEEVRHRWAEVLNG